MLANVVDVPRVTHYATAKEVAAVLVAAGALSGSDPARTVWKWARARRIACRRLPGARGRVLIVVDAEGFPVPTPAR